MLDPLTNPLVEMAEKMQESKLKVPPPVFTEMNGEFISNDTDAKTMTIAFPVE